MFEPITKAEEEAGSINDLRPKSPSRGGSNRLNQLRDKRKNSEPNSINKDPTTDDKAPSESDSGEKPHNRRNDAISSRADKLLPEIEAPALPISALQRLEGEAPKKTAVPD